MKIRITKLPKYVNGGTPKLEDFGHNEELYQAALEQFLTTGQFENNQPTNTSSVRTVSSNKKNVTKSPYNGASVVDFLGKQGKANDYNSRKQLAKSLGIENYSGRDDQNLQMIKILKQSNRQEKPVNNLPGNNTIGMNAIQGFISENPFERNPDKNAQLKSNSERSGSLYKDDIPVNQNVTVHSTRSKLPNTVSQNDRLQQYFKKEGISAYQNSNPNNTSSFNQGKIIPGRTHKQVKHDDTFILDQIGKDPHSIANINSRKRKQFAIDLAVGTFAPALAEGALMAATTRYLPYGLTELSTGVNKAFPMAQKFLQSSVPQKLLNNAVGKGFTMPFRQGVGMPFAYGGSIDFAKAHPFERAFGGPVEGDKPIKKRKVTLPGQLKVQITPAQPESLFSDQDGYAPLYQGNKAVGYPVRMNDVPGSVGLAMMDGSGIVPNSNRLTQGYFNQNDSQVRDNNLFLNGFGNPTPQFANGGRVQTNHAFNWDNNYQTGNETNGEQGFRSTLRADPREQANVEAERGETALGDFDGDGQLEHMNIGGERHFNGGTPLQLPQGAFIFSDTRKMKLGGPILAEFGKSEKTKQKFTPAKLSKQYDINLFKQKLKDESDDKYATDTAELMIENNQEHLAKLAYVQEAMKGFPNGMPQVAQQLMGEEQQQAPMARMGGSFGLPKAKDGLNDPSDPFGMKKLFIPQNSNTFPYRPNNITPYTGDQYENKNNASRFSAKEIGDRLRTMGYPGTDLTGNAANKDAQKWLYKNSPKSRIIIDSLHKQHPGTHIGDPSDDRFDGKWGYRWDSALFDEERPSVTPKIFNTGTPSVIPLPKQVPGIAAPQSENPGINTNTPAYTNGNPTTIGPNAIDVMNLVHAAGRPIDHIRPQLFRTNAQISNPTLLDNTAEIQQIQSNANTANQVVQNTANGQMARINSMGITGRLFDPINQSNGQTNNGNVQIMNQWNQQRDQVMNQQASYNMESLKNFKLLNDAYKVNLSKEKQLKFTDIATQGENMINNPFTMASILERTPNMTVKGPFWNPSFKPGVPETDLLTRNTQGANARATPEEIVTFIKDRENAGVKVSWNEAAEYLNGTNRTRKTYKRSDPQPDETQTTHTT